MRSAADSHWRDGQVRSVPSTEIHGAMITIIVPAFNIEDFIAACLNSVRAQTHEKWQCLVIDDGSTDKTVEKAREVFDPRISVISQSNAGVSAARNSGLAQAQGELIMFLDGDDLLHPQALERLAAKLKMRTEAVAAFGTFFKILADGRPYPGQKPLSEHRYPDGDILRHVLRHNFFANGGHVLIHREAVLATGGFDPSLRLSEDWEFWCRLAAIGHFAFVGNEPHVLSLRVRPGSSSGGLSAHWENHFPSINAIASNTSIRQRFSERDWRRVARSMRASAMWEAGRVNFTMRRFRQAAKLMSRALLVEPTPKRIVLVFAALIQMLSGRQLVSRLRYRDADKPLPSSSTEESRSSSSIKKT
jgi:glycosyltransferase involved in cell wall biosynthesis